MGILQMNSQDKQAFKIPVNADSTIEEKSEENECTISMDNKSVSVGNFGEEKSLLSKSIPNSQIDVSANIERNV